MKLNFRGWNRQVKPHSHKVTPVNSTGNSFRPNPAGPLVWKSSESAFGKVSGLGLSGNFLIEFKFDDDELRNWLERFTAEKPEAALPLLAEMQAKAVLALHRKPHKATEDDLE